MVDVRPLEAFANSLAIGLLSTLISTVIGALLALALWRFRFPGKPALEGAMALPIVIPEICMGVALMAFFIRTGWPTALPWPLNLGPIIIGHVAFSFPFVAIVVRARMRPSATTTTAGHRSWSRGWARRGAALAAHQALQRAART